VQASDRAAMRDIHLEILREICRPAREAFAIYKLNFPPRVEQELVTFTVASGRCRRNGWPRRAPVTAPSCSIPDGVREDRISRLNSAPRPAS
jgi:hypothetical protein